MTHHPPVEVIGEAGLADPESNADGSIRPLAGGPLVLGEKAGS
jgi:hypothetical protein